MRSDQIKLNQHSSVPHANCDTMQFADYISKQSPRCFLDVGTGSGYIAIRLARAGAEVMACDIASQAVALAIENARLNQLTFPILNSDMFKNVSGVFDGIAFNCPFSMTMDVFPVSILKEWVRMISPVESYFLRNVPASVLSFRRKLLSRFIIESKEHLAPSGSLFVMLVGPEKSWLQETFLEMDTTFFEDYNLSKRNLLFARLSLR